MHCSCGRSPRRTRATSTSPVAWSSGVWRSATALGDRFFAAQGRSVLGFLELSLDRPSEALEHLRAADDALNAMGVKEPGAFPHRDDLVEALIATGHTEEAQSGSTQLRALGERVDRPRLLCIALRGAGDARGAWWRSEHAVTLFEEALALHDRFPAPLERGRTLLALGMTHRRAKHRRAARERLREAETLFDDIGAAIWRDRAGRELGRISGRVAGEPGRADVDGATDRRARRNGQEQPRGRRRAVRHRAHGRGEPDADLREGRRPLAR